MSSMGSGTFGDIEVGSVEIKNADDDTRAKVGAGSGMAVGDNAVAVADANVKSDTSAIKTAVETIDNIVADGISIKKYTDIKTGELTGSTTAFQMPDISCSMVNFKAVLSNAGNVYIGISGITAVNGTTDTTSGFELGPGDETGFIPVDNLNRFYRISTNVGDDLTYLTY